MQFEIVHWVFAATAYSQNYYAVLCVDIRKYWASETCQICRQSEAQSRAVRDLARQSPYGRDASSIGFNVGFGLQLSYPSTSP